MKLGIVHPSKYKKCKKCDKVISNIKHKMYNKCYYEQKENNMENNRVNNIREYFINNNNEERVIRNLGYVDQIKYK